ncbi:MAG: hypothetical protein ACRD1H_13980 [Vicinamibacterales bacterium]
MKRRTLLQLLMSGVAALTSRIGLQAQTTSLSSADADRIRALADVVLPEEIGSDGRTRAVTSFLTWLRDYRADAETDHGYGFPRMRRTPPSPATRYPAQLEALEAAARARGPSFAGTTRDEQRAIVEAAILAAKVERLPGRPDGGHIATDLMGFFFDSVEGRDLCYRAQIGRDTCRALAGSDERPAPLTTGGR